MKRKLSAMLLVVILALVSSCGDGITTADETTVSSDSVETTVPVSGYDWSELDCGGDGFTILNSTDTYGFYNVLDFETSTGDRLDDAVYNRNRQIEEKYRFKLEIVDENHRESSDKFREAVMSGDDIYDAAFIWVNNLNALMSDGCFMNLYDVPEMQLDKSWWDQNTLESMKIADDNKLYFAFCNTQLVKFEGTQAVFMNLDKFDRLGIDAPYELVKDGKWTIDKFHEIASKGANLNGDDSFAWNKDGNAEYGIAGNEGTSYGLIYSCGNRFIEKDKSGTPYFALETDRFYETASKISQITFTEGEFVFINSSGEDHYEMAFKNNRSLLMTAEIKAASKYRDVDFSFGIVPFPKLDEEQENYIAVGGFAHAAVIPATNKDPGRAGAILDGLAYLSDKDVMPEFYNNTMSQKRLRDDKSIEMLQIISENFYLDPGEIYSWTHELREALISDFVFNPSDAFASTVAKYRDKVKTNIQTTINDFSEKNG